MVDFIVEFGWGGSAVRTCLRVNSLQTGYFTGNLRFSTPVFIFDPSIQRIKGENRRIPCAIEQGIHFELQAIMKMDQGRQKLLFMRGLA
ncbi:hypothetical protein [Tardiphaga sp. 841_E9_N1_2]|uniref:hypothetical protein n=1 Tax=Tardiphaga sp. 841_E9_N1_2 TaxID=3240762 RepID=UPI003F28729E